MTPQTNTSKGRQDIFLLQSSLIIGAVLLLANAMYFYPHIVDDAYISLRYSERLLHGKGLTWNDGERVEGYSNFLWVLLNAGLMGLGFDPEASVLFLGLACSFAMLLAFAWHARQANLSPWALCAGILVFAATPEVAMWAVGGLETPMVMLLFGWAAVLCYPLLNEASHRAACLAGMALALICLLRPEGPVYTVAIAGGLLLFSALPLRRRMHMLVILCAIPLACYSLHLTFRLYYYGQFVPNTVMAKVAFTPERLLHGVFFSIGALIAFMPLLLYSLLNHMNDRKKPGHGERRRFPRFLLAVCALMAIAISLGGGDIFKGFRAYVPLVPLLILLVMHSADIGLKNGSLRKERLTFLCVLAIHAWMQFSIGDNNSAKGVTVWVNHAKQLGLALKGKYAGAQPTIAVLAAGATPFYSELPSFDVYGLNDADLTARRYSDKNFGKGLEGHELFDPDYIGTRKPDVLIFAIPELPGLTYDCEQTPRCDALLSHYRRETIGIPGYEVPIWVRKDSRKVN